MNEQVCDKCGKNEAEFEISVDMEGSRVFNLCENCTTELINKLIANTQQEANDD